ncbi:hypothetical protein AMTRI_Chr12g267930 [Amborella trichopoda]
MANIAVSSGGRKSADKPRDPNQTNGRHMCKKRRREGSQHGELDKTTPPQISDQRDPDEMLSATTMEKRATLLVSVGPRQR